MAARKFAIAKQLGGKRVITNKGEEIGRLLDIQINEGNGDLESFVVEPSAESKLAHALARDGDTITIPFKAVFSISDVIVVDESLLH